jgi:hypothetical protein
VGQFDYVFVLRRRSTTSVGAAEVVGSDGASDHDLVVVGLEESFCPRQLSAAESQMR